MKQVYIFTVLLSSLSFAQSSRWQRAEPVQTDLYLFHSPYVAMLPTAETLQRGDWEFEVSHRFSTPISEGEQTFWGMDGPALIRLALGYAVSDKMMIHVGRTNLQDNLELQLKYKAIQIRQKNFPVLIGFRGGVAYNGEIYDPIKSDARRFQYYGQVIVNTMIQDKLGFGVVPTYLYNAHIFCVDPQYSFTLGNYLQYYVSPHWSLLAEWNPTVSGWRQKYDSLTLGVELETGGHFFKIFLSNNDKVNTSQYSAGADKDFAQGDFRIGFMITRTF
ncbi:hypothetical protein EH223_15325 [candidate division KSB1 bacterium]|nr:hypothetical protein [candidate division KSB1 bacterium]RQW01286.1 MAG: hypothetical protein EH223_15325 [candidate division KSB1 bacterium]